MDLTTALTFVREHRRGVLVSQKRDGRPQLSNIMLRGRTTTASIRISITADRAKYKNLARDPRASLHVTPGGLLRLRRCSRATWSSAPSPRRPTMPRSTSSSTSTAPWAASTPTGTSSAKRWSPTVASSLRLTPDPRLRHAAQLTGGVRPRRPRPATERALGGRPLSQATGALGPMSSACDRPRPMRARSVAGGLHRPSGGAGQRSRGPDGRHDLAGTIAVRVPREAEDDPAFEDELVLPWAVPLEDVAALVVSPIELDGDLQLRVGQVDLRELPSVRIVDGVVDDRFRQSMLNQQREHQKFEVAVCDLVPVDAIGDRSSQPPDPGPPTASVLRERCDQLGP